MKVGVNLHDTNILSKIKDEIIDYVIENTENQIKAAKVLGVSERTLRQYNKKSKKKSEMKKLVDYVVRFLNGSKNKVVDKYLRNTLNEETYIKLRSEILDKDNDLRKNLAELGTIVEKVRENKILSNRESTLCHVLYQYDLIDINGNFTIKGKNELLD